MKFKKKILSIILTTVVLSNTYMVFANEKAVIGEATDITTQSEEKTLQFESFSGKITAINDYLDESGKKVEGSKTIFLVNEENKETHFYLNDKTYYVDKGFKVGDTVTAFYDVNLPAVKIYPPRYTAVAVALNSNDKSVKVDRFDENLISSDQSLKLNISDKTVIVDQDNKVFTGELKNRKLIVVYSITTRSIPAQTSPSKVIVLFETAVAPIHTLTPEEIALLEKPDTVVENDKPLALTVNNVSLKNTTSFVNEKGVVMVPFRETCEALGLKISWDDKTKSIVLDSDISFEIGKDAYNLNKEKLTLGTASVIVNEKTFVPLKFFTEVLMLNNAYVLENTIFIDNGIKMD